MIVVLAICNVQGSYMNSTVDTEVLDHWLVGWLARLLVTVDYAVMNWDKHDSIVKFTKQAKYTYKYVQVDKNDEKISSTFSNILYVPT